MIRGTSRKTLSNSRGQSVNLMSFRINFGTFPQDKVRVNFMSAVIYPDRKAKTCIPQYCFIKKKDSKIYTLFHACVKIQNNELQFIRKSHDHSHG